MRLIVAFLAAWAIAAQDPSDVPALEERVRLLRTGNLFDAAQETLKKFAADHPALAEDSRFQRLEKATREIAREADRLFKERMTEARGHFDAERDAQAMDAFGRAL